MIPTNTNMYKHILIVMNLQSMTILSNRIYLNKNSLQLNAIHIAFLTITLSFLKVSSSRSSTSIYVSCILLTYICNTFSSYWHRLTINTNSSGVQFINSINLTSRSIQTHLITRVFYSQKDFL